jgi:hypothetical protein
MRHRIDSLKSDPRGTRIELHDDVSTIHSANEKRNPTMTTTETETEKVTRLPYRLTSENVIAFLQDQLGLKVPLEAAVEASAAMHPISGVPRRKIKGFKFKMADVDAAIAAKTELSLSDRIDLKTALDALGII